MSELAIWSAAATSKTSGAITEAKPVNCSKEIESTPRILTPAGFAAGGRLIDPQWERVSNDDGTEGTWHGSLRFCLAPTGTSKFLDGRVFKSWTSISPPRTRANARSRARLHVFFSVKQTAVGADRDCLRGGSAGEAGRDDEQCERAVRSWHAGVRSIGKLASLRDGCGRAAPRVEANAGVRIPAGIRASGFRRLPKISGSVACSSPAGSRPIVECNTMTYRWYLPTR